MSNRNNISQNLNYRNSSSNSSNDETNENNDKYDDIIGRMARSEQKHTKSKKVIDDDIQIEPKIEPKIESKSKKSSNEVNYDDVNFDELDATTRKAYVDLFTGMPDVYKLMGCSQDDAQNIINKKCTEKLKKYHPDRHSVLVEHLSEKDKPRELKKLGMQFKMIRDADSILRDPAKRKYYDLQKKTILSKNFVNQKESFEEFLKLQTSQISEQTKALAQQDFKMSFIEMDKKHGFNRQKYEESPLSVEETNRRHDELLLSRELDIAEYAPEDKFEGRAFSNEEFNRNWAKMKRKEQKKKGKGVTDDSLVAWEGISAANDFGMSGGSDYVPIDTNYEDLYSNTNFKDSSIYASRIDSDSDNNDVYSSGSDSELGDLDDFDGYSHNQENIVDRFNIMMNRRETENKEYDNRELHDKKSWKSVFNNPMNISSSMKTIVGGNDFNQLEGPRKKKVIGKDFANTYKELVYENIQENNEHMDINKNQTSRSNKLIGSIKSKKDKKL